MKLRDIKLWPEKWRLRSRSLSDPWMSLADRRRGTTDSEVRNSGPSQPYLGEAPTLQERRRRTRPTLVEGGRHTGESRVQYRGHYIPLHLLTKDFFISVVGLGTSYIMAGVAVLYLVAFFVWSFIWWLIVQFYPGCLYGASSYVEALTFAVVTQMTIGYGNTGPQACWVATWLIIIQSIIAVIMEAVVLGVVFARISHPHQRSRSIFMSNKAVVARRDGILKFMFRVADIRTTQVVEPKVKAYLYTWGAGRITAEGERIPVRVEPLDVDYIDGMLLLPLIIEHTIDERSPMCGHTHSSLVALNAELVVTFEGTTEMGNPFMARRSYIPDEIYWGHQFVNVMNARDDPEDDRYIVNLDNFHAVERQSGMPNLHPSQLSQLIVTRAKRTVPYPLLGENTLVLSDVLCVAPDEDGQLTLYCRVGDTYPNQMLEITAKMILYRWRRDPGAADAKTGPAPGGEAFEQISLECGYRTGTDRLHLRLPVLLTHPIDADSPLAGWREPGGVETDIASEIVVVVNAYMNVNNSNVLRQRTYNVSHHVRVGWGFVPVVKHPLLARDGKPRVRWQAFHDIQKVQGMEEMTWPPPRGQPVAGSGSGAVDVMSAAPESHANMRSFRLNALPAAFSGQYHNLNMERNDFTVLPMDLQRYAAAVGGDASQVTGSPKADDGPFVLFPSIGHRFDDDMTDADTSLPPATALHPALPGPERFRMDDGSMDMLPAMTLSRYDAEITRSDTLPRRGGRDFPKLPADFASEASEPSATTLVAAKPSTRRPSFGKVTTVVAPKEEEEGEGPLAGVHPIERSQSHLQETFGADEEEEDAGPMHFASSKTRLGAKSLKEISSLFRDEDDEGDGEGGSGGGGVGGGA